MKIKLFLFATILSFSFAACNQDDDDDDDDEEVIVTISDFYGTYSVVDDCGGSYTMVISASTTQPETEVLMDNLLGHFTTAVGVVNEASININNIEGINCNGDMAFLVVDGLGNYDDGVITAPYTASSNIPNCRVSGSCTLTATKQ